MEYIAEPKNPYQVSLQETVTDVLDYWDSRRGNLFAPNWGQFKLDELPPQAVPWCSVLDVKHEPLDFVFRFWGSGRAQVLGQEVTGKSLTSVVDSNIAKSTFDQNVMTMEQRVPLFFDTVAAPEYGDKVSYGVLRLPLSSDGTNVDKIFTISFNPDVRDQLHSVFGTVPAFGLSGPKKLDEN